MKKQLNNEIRRMQRLAGLINEDVEGRFADEAGLNISKNEPNKFTGKSKDVNVSVNIKTDKPVDKYKVQRYVDELVELVQSHINKG